MWKTTVLTHLPKAMTVASILLVVVCRLWIGGDWGCGAGW